VTYSVYVFLDGRNRPYYVGKTSSMARRKKEHVQEILNGNSLPKYNKARKLMQEGTKFIMKQIRVTKTEKEAFRLERYYIKKYRKRGYQLMNCTYGGPEEKPMKINKPKKLRRSGIVIPKTTKRSALGKKVVKVKKRKS
jgi:predicted GIY-YIG superfamily endonuclease